MDGRPHPTCLFSKRWQCYPSPILFQNAGEGFWLTRWIDYLLDQFLWLDRSGLWSAKAGSCAHPSCQVWGWADWAMPPHYRSPTRTREWRRSSPEERVYQCQKRDREKSWVGKKVLIKLAYSTDLIIVIKIQLSSWYWVLKPNVWLSDFPPSRDRHDLQYTPWSSELICNGFIVLLIRILVTKYIVLNQFLHRVPELPK